jgi:hypothetical protein
MRAFRAAVMSLMAVGIISTGAWYVTALLLGPLLHAWFPR